MEPPQGVKANMTRTYADLSPTFLATPDHPVSLSKTWRGLVFSCAFFHALVQVRTMNN